jgi:hypothetical protein
MPGRYAERWNPMKARYVAVLTIAAFALLATANPLHASETDLVTKLVLDIKGVKSVKNNMTVGK